MQDCIFCKIINKELPGYIVHEDSDVIVFLSLENHPLVVPKKHIKDIYELDAETGNKIMENLTKTAKAVKQGLGCDGVYITQANEPAAGQDVFHLHFHVYPRFEDPIMNQIENISDSRRAETLEKIKKAL